MAGIREKKTICGDNYMEVDIFPYIEFKRKGTRSKKKKESLISQKNINIKNAKRKLNQLIEANFNENDLHVVLTYNDQHLPSTLEEAQKEVYNYIERLKYRRKKRELQDIKYIVITAFNSIEDHEIDDEDKDINIVRAHHHIIMDGVLEREIVEDTWSKGRGKNKKSMGIVNARRLQPDNNTGLAALATYMLRQPTNKRRWSCSQNLTRPVSRTNDHKYSRRRFREIIRSYKDLDYWESQYPGYYIADKDSGYELSFNDFTQNWHIYIKMRKKE